MDKMRETNFKELYLFVDKSSKPAIMRTTLLEFAVLALLAFSPLHEQIGILFLFAIIFAGATAVFLAVAFMFALFLKEPIKKEVNERPKAQSYFSDAAIFVAVGALVGGFLGNIVSVVDHIFILHGTSYAAIGVFIILVPSVRRLPKINEIGKSQE